MSWKKDFRRLIVDLSQDPKVKIALETIREQTGGGAAKAGMAWQLLTVAGKFAGKKRARAIAEVVDVITLIVTLSLILKQNAFDRPEVRAFFERVWARTSKSTQKAYAQTSQRTLRAYARAEALVRKKLKKRKAAST